MLKRSAFRSFRRGALTFEWIVLLTVLAIGVIGALTLVRNALVREYVALTETITETDIGP